MTIELNMVVRPNRTQFIMFGEVFTGKGGRKYSMCDGMVRVIRFTVIMLDFRVNMDPRHNEHPQRYPAKKEEPSPVLIASNQ